jgi:hypothetical protein
MVFVTDEGVLNLTTISLPNSEVPAAIARQVVAVGAEAERPVRAGV